MIIIHLCTDGPYTDGSGYQENLLAKYHVKQGNRTYIICSKYTFDSKGQVIIDDRNFFVNDDGVNVIRLEYRLKISRITLFRNLLQTIDEIGPDILFLHGVSFADAITLSKYLKKHPQIVTYADNHADFSNSATNFISKNVLHKIIWRYCVHRIEPYVRKFYGVLPARVNFLENMYGLPTKKCELLVLGADDELVDAADKPEIKSEIRKKHNIADDDFLIMTGGKIDEFKTQTLLLMDAVNMINNPKVKLIVFGSVTQELMPKVQRLADGEKVQYVGWIDSKDSYKYFASSDLVVFPGRHSVFWEQVAAQGIPMLCKYWEGTTHVDVGGNVIFLYNDSIVEIYKNINALLDIPEKYERMKSVAREKGKSYFSYSKISKIAIEQDRIKDNENHYI